MLQQELCVLREASIAQRFEEARDGAARHTEALQGLVRQRHAGQNGVDGMAEPQQLLGVFGVAGRTAARLILLWNCHMDVFEATEATLPALQCWRRMLR